MAVYDRDLGFQRAIHNIESAPFRTKFEGDAASMRGNLGIACISDYEPQPLLFRSRLGNYAVATVGKINNEGFLVDEVLGKSRHFLEMSGGKINATELVAALISESESIEAGIHRAQTLIEGTMSILVLTPDAIYAARDFLGRLPVLIGQREDGYAVSFVSFAYEKLGYDDLRDLGPGEIVRVTPEGVEVLEPPQSTMRICAFLWTYYGYPNSHYEGRNVEVMRNRCGEIMAEHDIAEGNLAQNSDIIAGIPDSGTGHAIGYSNRSGRPFGRPFIKYTPTWPRSFMPTQQSMRNLVARMKLVPVKELIDGKRLLFVDDSIVRGTQMRETVEFLYGNGAKEVHVRSACPPLVYGCKYLNFSRSGAAREMIAQLAIEALEGKGGFDHMTEYADATTARGQAIVEHIRKSLHFDSLRFQTIQGVLDSIGIDPCKVCTYCWTGKE
jgi:amidophosphoribosyltransferase